MGSQQSFTGMGRSINEVNDLNYFAWYVRGALVIVLVPLLFTCIINLVWNWASSLVELPQSGSCIPSNTFSMCSSMELFAPCLL